MSTITLNNTQPDFAGEFQQSVNPALAEFDRLVRLRLVQAAGERARQAIDRRIQFIELTRNIVGRSLK